ncbi:hypothetical protein GH714_011527 [Hevea brasiliensis]|uniref:Uncharacterized protein n=1 Tax=Hevea brasiliensis TaxID=3981 RepID=A0A6A6K467_HEVBR|nr:hypothetical protein GH714_011527 [Hevea brasiliensis]
MGGEIEGFDRHKRDGVKGSNKNFEPFLILPFLVMISLTTFPAASAAAKGGEISRNRGCSASGISRVRVLGDSGSFDCGGFVVDCDWDLVRKSLGLDFETILTPEGKVVDDDNTLRSTGFDPGTLQIIWTRTRSTDSRKIYEKSSAV